MIIPLIKPCAIIFGTLIFLFIPLISQAEVIVVNPGDDLADALSVTAEGDSVCVMPGNYLANNISMPSGIVMLTPDSELSPVLYSSDGSVILHCENLSAETRIEGITFQRINPPLEKLPHRGAGVYSIDSAAVFDNCKFIDLMAVYGGAVYCATGQAPSFINCYFEGNSSQASGGAINAVGSRDLFLDHCLFTANTAAGGGNVLNAALAASARVTYCTMSGNGQPGGTDIAVWDAQLVEVGNSIIAESLGRASYGDHESTPWYHCTDIYGNSDGNWLGALADQAELEGNISLNPMFCGDDGSYSLYDLDEDSPCTAEANPACGSMGAMGIGCDSSTGIDDLVEPEISENQTQGQLPKPFQSSNHH